MRFVTYKQTVPDRYLPAHFNLSNDNLSFFYYTAYRGSILEMSALLPGSLVLVTGANGYIGSVAVKTLIDRGYRVRGAVRSLRASQWMTELFGSSLTLVEVGDLATDGAYNEAIMGVDGILHIAANVRIDPSETEMVSGAVRGVRNILEAASKETSVRRVVLTSSQVACMATVPGVPYHITADTFNIEATKTWEQVCSSKRPAAERGLMLYTAAKTLSELEARAFVREKQPHFVVNYVVPDCNMGTVVSLRDQGFISSSGLLYSLSLGIDAGARLLPSQWYVDVEDTALLHVAALCIDEVRGERLFAFAGPFGWRDVLEIMHRRYPQRQGMVKDFHEPAVDIGTVENTRSVQLLKMMGKPNGFSTLEETVVKNMDKVMEADTLLHFPKGVLHRLFPTSHA